MTGPRLLIECSEDSLSDIAPGVSTVETVEVLKQAAMLDFGVSVDFVIYQGMVSLYGGGRMVARSPEEIRQSASVLNEHGISFALALNGGLTLPGEIELTGADIAVLEVLDGNCRRYSVKNKVIVTHEKMLGFIRTRYSSLEVIASCIQAVNPRLHGGYAERVSEYDYVVFMNQHSTYEYLRQYAAYASKLILFLTIRCGNGDLAKCYAHYAEMEEPYGDSSRRQSLAEGELPEYEPSVLPGDAFGCLLLDKFGPRVALLDREPDLSRLMQMGVNKFKIARLSPFPWSTYRKLLGLSQQHLRKDH